MRIITATVEDVPRIMECARQFCAVLKHPLNEKHYGQFWERALTCVQGNIFLLEDDSGNVAGGIGGLTHPDLLSGQLCAVELFWYVKPEFRKGLWPVRLLKEFERWAEKSGCRTVAMVYMQDSQPEKMKEFYERSGYRLQESHYIKNL